MEREWAEIVVVTGSSGCLGQQTVKLLISHDEKVREIRCLDLVEPSEQMRGCVQSELNKLQADATDKENGSAAQRRKVVKYITGDIRDINTVESCLEGADCVLHCAAATAIWTEPGEQDAVELESVNVQGTENLLAACVRLGVPKFVHVSSFETFVSFHTIYYATESTLPEPRWLMFGPSAETKREAENKVRQFSNNKLKLKRPGKSDALNAVILRFTPIYGPNDKHYVTPLLRIANYFNGTLRRFSNVWIRQQPIFVGNAAWSLIRAKRRMDTDESISREGKFSRRVTSRTGPELASSLGGKLTNAIARLPHHRRHANRRPLRLPGPISRVPRHARHQSGLARLARLVLHVPAGFRLEVLEVFGRVQFGVQGQEESAGRGPRTGQGEKFSGASTPPGARVGSGGRQPAARWRHQPRMAQPDHAADVLLHVQLALSEPHQGEPPAGLRAAV